MATDAQSSSPPAEMVPVAIYTRVSTDNQVGGRFDSCESQLAVCRDHVRKNAALGWVEVGHFTDPAFSGSTMNRPGLGPFNSTTAARNLPSRWLLNANRRKLTAAPQKRRQLSGERQIMVV